VPQARRAAHGCLIADRFQQVGCLLKRSEHHEGFAADVGFDGHDRQSHQPRTAAYVWQVGAVLVGLVNVVGDALRPMMASSAFAALWHPLSASVAAVESLPAIDTESIMRSGGIR